MYAAIQFTMSGVSSVVLNSLILTFFLCVSMLTMQAGCFKWFVEYVYVQEMSAGNETKVLHGLCQ